MLATEIDLHDFENLQIFGNEIVIDENDNFQGYDEKLPFLGKNYAITNEIIGNRKNIIVMGDIEQDLTMVENLDYKNIIRIGFLNNPSEIEKEYMT